MPQTLAMQLSLITKVLNLIKVLFLPWATCVYTVHVIHLTIKREIFAKIISSFFPFIGLRIRPRA